MPSALALTEIREHTSVDVFCLLSCWVTTLRSFSSSQSFMSSDRQSTAHRNVGDSPFFLSSLVSSYRLTFSTLRPTLGSCENLHLFPDCQLILRSWGIVAYPSHNAHSWNIHKVPKRQHSITLSFDIAVLSLDLDVSYWPDSSNVSSPVPNGTFCTGWAVLNSSASIFFLSSNCCFAFALSSAAFSFASYHPKSIHIERW